MHNDPLAVDPHIAFLPLTKIFGDCPCHLTGEKTPTCSFLFMGRFGHVFAYKHDVTRSYLNLDLEGNAYRYTTHGYVSMDREDAIRNALPIEVPPLPAPGFVVPDALPWDEPLFP